MRWFKFSKLIWTMLLWRELNNMPVTRNFKHNIKHQKYEKFCFWPISEFVDILELSQSERVDCYYFRFGHLLYIEVYCRKLYPTGVWFLVFLDIFQRSPIKYTALWKKLPLDFAFHRSVYELFASWIHKHMISKWSPHFK